MATILLTGASGGIGRHLKAHLSKKHEVLTLSRDVAKTSGELQPCDLTTQIPRFATPSQAAANRCQSGTQSESVTTEEPETPKVDWIVHLATTYDVEQDLAMLDNLIEFANDHRVRGFLYVSSWVVHFPRRPLRASYIEMKRRCESKLLKSNIVNPRIIRPSVVLGDGLSWTRVLQRLAPFSWAIPPRFTRSFVSVEEVCGVMEGMLENESEPGIVTSLGTRAPLAEQARRHGKGQPALMPRIAIIGSLAVLIGLLFWSSPAARWHLAELAITFVLLAAALRYALPALLGSVSDYFAGFVVTDFEPETEDEVLALCHRSNMNIQIRGYDNARLYFMRRHDPRITTIVLKQFDGVRRLDPEFGIVEVDSGIHFAKLLRYLESNDRWLENYPNYHYITVGACIATAVHGSNLDKPFLADLVESFRIYERASGRIVELRRGEEAFNRAIFDPSKLSDCIVLTARLRTCDRQYYQLTTELQPVASLDFGNLSAETSAARHFEVRINTPLSRQAKLQSYRQFPAVADNVTSDGALLDIKADSIGRKWNLLQANGFLSALTSSISRCFVNYEWFFTPEQFREFWQEIRSDRSRYQLYKLLVRYNRRQADLETPYHGTISIDVTILHTKTMLNRSADLFQRYKPLEHLGKYSIERYAKNQQ